jgi:hypothetical protein
MRDEDFVARLRPDSVFGALGASDFEDEEVEEFGEMADGWDGSEPDSFSEDAQFSPAANNNVATPTMQPSFQSAGGGSTSAGLGLLWLVGGGAVGWHYGRAKGAAGGALAAAGVRNLYRAQGDFRSPSGDVKASAVRPALIGLVGVGLGGYLLHAATTGRTDKK